MDLEGSKQTAREAKELLDSPAYKLAVGSLHTRLNSTLMGCSDPQRQLHLVAQLQALMAIELELKSLVDNQKVMEKRNGR